MLDCCRLEIDEASNTNPHCLTRLCLSYDMNIIQAYKWSIAGIGESLKLQMQWRSQNVRRRSKHFDGIELKAPHKSLIDEKTSLKYVWSFICAKINKETRVESTNVSFHRCYPRSFVSKSILLFYWWFIRKLNLRDAYIILILMT